MVPDKHRLALDSKTTPITLIFDVKHRSSEKSNWSKEFCGDALFLDDEDITRTGTSKTRKSSDAV